MGIDLGRAQGKKATVLVDKLGERLAFERGSARLFEALAAKLEALGTWRGGPTRADLQHLRAQELAHFHALEKRMKALGVDESAVTPSATVHEVSSIGVRLVVEDPSTNLLHALEAVLMAELTDNDCWLNLVRLALAWGEVDLARECERFLAEEDEHLLMVREWLAAGLSMEAFGDPHVIADVGTRRDAMESDSQLGPPVDVLPELRQPQTSPPPKKKRPARGRKIH